MITPEKIINSLPVVLILLDDKGKITFINQALERITGYNPEKVVGRKPTDLEFMTEEGIKIFNTMENEKDEIDYDIPIIDGNNKKHILSMFKVTIKDDKGKITHLYIGKDVTELRAQEERDLDQLKKLSFALIESIPDFHMVLDDNCKAIKMNTGVEVITGYKTDELMGKNIDEFPFFPKEALNIFYKVWDKLKKGEETYAVDIPFITKDGFNRIGSLALTNIVVDDNILNYMLTIRDVTEDREVRKEKKELTKITEEVIKIMEFIGSGIYDERVSVNYDDPNAQLLAETINLVMDHLKQSDMELKSLIKELATPAIEIMRGVVVMPLVGKLTSERAHDAMRGILRALERTRGQVAILDITGVSSIDSAVADSIIKTMKSIKLVGAIPVLTGISAETAEILVNLGAEFDFITKGTLSEGLEEATKIIK